MASVTNFIDDKTTLLGELLGVERPFGIIL
jgi:hypothetical protein